MIRSNVVKEPVYRYYADVKWIHTALKFDYPGILMPQLPENKKDSINMYFKSLLLIDQLRISYTLHFFVSCVSEQLFSEFKIKKQIKRGHLNISTLLKEPSKLINKNSVSPKDLDELVYRAGKLGEVPISDRTAYKDFCAKVNEIAQHTSLVFGELKKAMDSLNTQIASITKSFHHIADLFGNLALQGKKVSTVKDRYLDARLSYLDMEQVYLKYKSLFYNAGRLIRKHLYESIFQFTASELFQGEKAFRGSRALL